MGKIIFDNFKWTWKLWSIHVAIHFWVASLKFLVSTVIGTLVVASLLGKLEGHFDKVLKISEAVSVVIMNKKKPILDL